VSSHSGSEGQIPIRGGPSRRALLRGGIGAIGGVGLASALAGCGSPIAAGLAGTQIAPGTVTFWNLFGGGDGARLTVMLDQYEKNHGGSGSLQAATFAWGNPYYTKVALATIGNKPPDVAISHLTRAKNLAEGGLLTPITDDMLALVDLKPSDFTDRVWQAQKLNGTSYAIPLDTHPLVLFYNETVCKKAGLLGADGKLKTITGTDEWEAALTAIKKVTGQYGATTGSIADPSNSWRWFTTLYQQMNGSTPFLSDNGGKLTYNKDLVLKTLAYIRKLTASGLMPASIDTPGAETLMFTGKSGFFINGEWEITTAQAIEGLKFSIVPIPKLFDKKAAFADSHTFVLPATDRSPAQLKRTMGFVKSMLDQSLTWAKGGHIPAYLPVKDSAAYKQLTPQSNYVEVADYAVYDPLAWYSGSGSNFENIVGAQIGLVQQGLASPVQALASIRQQLLTYVDTPSPL